MMPWKGPTLVGLRRHASRSPRMTQGASPRQGLRGTCPLTCPTMHGAHGAPLDLAAPHTSRAKENRPELQCCALSAHKRGWSKEATPELVRLVSKDIDNLAQKRVAVVTTSRP